MTFSWFRHLSLLFLLLLLLTFAYICHKYLLPFARCMPGLVEMAIETWSNSQALFAVVIPASSPLRIYLACKSNPDAAPLYTPNDTHTHSANKIHDKLPTITNGTRFAFSTCQNILYTIMPHEMYLRFLYDDDDGGAYAIWKFKMNAIFSFGCRHRWARICFIYFLHFPNWHIWSTRAVAPRALAQEKNKIAYWDAIRIGGVSRAHNPTAGTLGRPLRNRGVCACASAVCGLVRRNHLIDKT